MIKYFAKYCPVKGKGKIKEGDLVMEPNGVVYRVGGLGMDTGFTLLNHLDGSFYDMSDLFTKVKLFLCSRNIKVGDNVFNPKTNQYEDVVSFNPEIGCISYNSTTLNEVEISKSFKIIGEISPDNTWVKENDQFDEEDVFASLIGTMNNEGKSASLLTSEDINFYYINTEHK